MVAPSRPNSFNFKAVNVSNWRFAFRHGEINGLVGKSRGNHGSCMFLPSTNARFPVSFLIIQFWKSSASNQRLSYWPFLRTNLHRLLFGWSTSRGWATHYRLKIQRLFEPPNIDHFLTLMIFSYNLLLTPSFRYFTSVTVSNNRLNPCFTYQCNHETISLVICSMIK